MFRNIVVFIYIIKKLTNFGYCAMLGAWAAISWDAKDKRLITGFALKSSRSGEGRGRAASLAVHQGEGQHLCRHLDAQIRRLQGLIGGVEQVRRLTGRRAPGG